MIITVSLNTALDRVYRIDDFHVGGRFRVDRVHEIAGGKALNVARVARQLGAQVTVVGFVAGFTGMRIEELARSEGIQTDFVRVQGESRQCHTFVHTGRASTEVLEPGPTIAADDIEALKERLRDLVKEGDLVCLSGSTPPGVPETIYAELVELCHSAGARALVDASRDALRCALPSRPYAIKPNRPELEEYLRRRVSLSELPEVALGLHRQGIAWVLVSLGEDGMIAAAAGHVWRVKVPSIEVVTAVGSGDAFVGGWAATLQQYGQRDEPGEELIVEALKRGSAAGVSNALQLQTGTCDPGQVDELMERIEVAKVL